MKKIYKILLVTLFVFSTGIAKADFVSVNTAQTAATKYLDLNGVTNSLTLVHTEYVGSAEMFYVFDITGGGYIIISADDRMKPIRAYVPGGNYIVNSENPGISVWKSWNEKYFVDSILSTTQTTRKITDWDVFINPPNNNQSELVVQVGPLLNTTWEQRSCFNDVIMSILPGASNFIDIPVGCVATAASQIMNYYQHPYRGVGSSTAGSSCPGVFCGMTNPSLYPLTVNHEDANSTFDWSNISTGGSGTTCLATDQTAQLCYDVAIAVDMDFDSSGSGSFSSRVDDMLEDHYGYDDWVQYNQGGNNTNAGWITMLRDEIDADRPMQYKGSDPNGGGHAWVCDGYNTTSTSTIFHMNWGWAGQDDGFYSVTPFTGQLLNNTFSPSSFHAIVRRIRPGTDLENYTGANAVSYSGNVLSHDVLNDFVDGLNDAYCNPFTIKYYASTNTNITTSDEYLGSITRSSGLQGFRYFTCNKTIDPTTYNIPSGNYYIGWIIDSESEVWEISESNNKGHYSSTVYFPGQADLEITNEHYSIGMLCFPPPCTTPPPPVSLSGTTIDFNVEVANDINATASSSSTYLGYYLSSNTSIVPSAGADHLLGDDYVTSLSPGSSSTETATFDLSSATFNSIPNGTYYIGAYADHLYTETESNENNNDAAFNWTNNISVINPISGHYQITIERGCTDSTAVNYSATANIDDGSCTYPDLEITNEHHSIILFGTTTPPVSISGTTIDFNVEVSNNGTTSAEPSQLGYYLSLNASIVPSAGLDHLLGTDQVDGGWLITGLPPQLSHSNLAVGATSTETATFDLSSSAFNSIPNGTYYIGAYADHDYALYESNENNNDAAFNWTNNILLINPTGYYQITIERGCTDSTAVNYSVTANIDDGSCLTAYGCTDSMACNYDPTATVDDSSCVFQSGSSIDLTLGTWIWYWDATCAAVAAGFADPNSIAFNANGTGTFAGTFPLVWSLCNDVFTMWYGGASGNYLSLWTGNVINGMVHGPHIQTWLGCYAIAPVSVSGCTDPTACNYNSAATVDDGSCNYDTTGSATVLSCSTYMWNNVLYITSGVFTQTFTANNGCDSIVTLSLTIGGVSGCTDSTACNYDSLATCDDGSCYGLLGCTDPLASNYNSNATCDDGSCIYPLSGCTDPIACNYDPTATVDDGSCTYLSSPAVDMTIGTWTLEWDFGCTGTSSTTTMTFNANGTGAIGATIVNWSMCGNTYSHSYTSGTVYTGTYTANGIISGTMVTASGSTGCFTLTPVSVSGCTDPTACNYNSAATIDDGSCNYDTTGSFTVLSCSTYMWNSVLYITSGVFTQTFTANNGCDSIVTLNLTIGGVLGCTDPTACNYNPLANCDDGSCYGLLGCTDPLASNYNSNATCDDGSCQYICASPVPAGLSVTGLTHDRAKVNWLAANTSLCLVEMYRIQYREQGTTAWNTKTALGSGLCNFGLLTTSKMLWSLTPSTVYEYRAKAWYCSSSASTWSSISTFTTLNACPNVLNFAVSTPLTTRATFTWTAPSSPYSFVRIKLRVDSVGAPWFTAGGFGVMYPALTRNKNGLTPGESYLASSRTWCNPLGGAHKALTWTPFIYWIQPTNSSKIESDNSTIENLTIYPNPSRDIFNVSFVSDEVQNLDISITNVVGEAIYTADLNQFVGQFTKEVSLATYPKGVYFLQIITDKGVVTKKLTLQ